MALCCGCEMIGGSPVSMETLKAHYKHTFEVLLFWELMHRKGAIPSDNLKLSQARINLIEAIDELYPEASSD